ncbi:MAG: helix-turn-helix transcriptional regulator [bacterium]|nr:helix-turn-helix transcriptional regulator [bacterium]
MGSSPTKAAENMYCKCRLAAAKYNDKLNSREGAAELLGLSPSTLANYELNLTKIVPVESIALMADVYNAPELKRWYCKNACPLGEDMPVVELAELDRITVRALATFRKLAGVKDSLLDITADGIITEDEKPTLDNIIATLKELNEVAQTLMLWAEKNVKE